VRDNGTDYKSAPAWLCRRGKNNPEQGFFISGRTVRKNKILLFVAIVSKKNRIFV